MLEHGRSHLFPAGHSVYRKLPEFFAQRIEFREVLHLFFFFCEITCDLVDLLTLFLHESVS